VVVVLLVVVVVEEVVVVDDVVVVSGGGSVVVVVGARVVVVVVGARVVAVVVGAAVVAVVGGGVLTVSVKGSETLPPSVKEYVYVPGAALVPIWKLNENVGALPDLPTDTPGALPLMATFPPGMSVVTLTPTEPPGRRVADWGLTPVIAAHAGDAVTIRVIDRAAPRRTLPASGMPIRTL
jgi:FtsP/CotA-like multicopper oxidase with cupredoxin domain